MRWSGRTQEKLDHAAAGIRRNGGEASGFAADVRDYAALAAALQKTRDLYGEIDILLCGAAGNFPAPALGMSANGFKAVIDIDLLGTFNTCRAAYEHLRKPGASIIAHLGHPRLPSHPSSSARLRGKGRRRHPHQDLGDRMGTCGRAREHRYARPG